MDTKRLTKVTAGCTVAMLIPTIILGWWAIDWAQGVAKWSEAADEFPTVDELRGPAIPDAENAALVYQQAWEALDLTDSEGRLLASSDDPAVLAPILAKNREPLRLFHEAALMEHCRFEGEPDPSGIGLLFPHLSPMRDLARLLRAEVLVALSRGDTDRALHAIEDPTRHVAQRFQSPCNIIDFLSASSHHAYAEQSLGYLVAATDLPAERSVALRQRLLALTPDAACVAATRIDIALALEDFGSMGERDAPANDARAQPLRTASPNLPYSLLLVLNRAKFMQVAQAILEKADVPWRDIARMELTPVPEGMLYPFVSLMLPFGNPARVRDSDLALREMMVVALDISAFAAENGRLPASLDELPQSDEPDYALDPFSGERLRYEPGEGRAFKLWSVGRDLDDDGGVARGDKPDLSPDEIDLVFRVSP